MQNKARSKSNKKFMLLSAIGILMVVDHHTWITFNLFGDFIPYNSFFMPMFVFISGYFNKVNDSTDLAGFTSPFIVTPMISSIVGILFWLTLTDMAGGALFESRFVNYMSCNTFWIMGLHITFFNIVNCILLTVHEHITPLLYFDAEYFKESEWYYWEISPAFKRVYLTTGILGPLALKKMYDLAVYRIFYRPEKIQENK